MSDHCLGCGDRQRGLTIGDKLHGFCHGLFGRDSYGEKTVIAMGRDWVLLSEPGWAGNRQVRVLHAYDGDPDELLEYVTRSDI